MNVKKEAAEYRRAKEIEVKNFSRLGQVMLSANLGVVDPDIDVDEPFAALDSLNDGDGLRTSWNEINIPPGEAHMHMVEIGRYLLIERSPQYGKRWFSLHATIEDAAGYHDGQENPEDWPVLELVDLDEPFKEFYAETTTVFIERDRV
jgi:hypothetical protein